VKNVASAPARSSESAVAITSTRLPRKIAGPPAPATIPPLRNRVRLGGDVQADATIRHNPARVGAIPAVISRCGCQLVVVWTATPEPKHRKIVRPHYRDAGQHARSQQAGERSPDKKRCGCDDCNRERWQQHRAAALPVRHVPDEQETAHRAEGVDRVDNGDRE
jgi:hypothetical protein